MKHRAFLFFGLVFVLSASITAPLQAQVCPQDLTCDAYVGSLGVGTDNRFAQLHVVGAGPFDGTGVISSGIGSEVIGSGTQFTVELHVGDIIAAGGQARIVQSIRSDIALTVNSPFPPTMIGATFTIQQPVTRLDDSTGTNRFMVNSAGNVGIGTTNPQARLDVAGGALQISPGSYLRFTTTTSGGSNERWIGWGGSFGTSLAFYAPSGQGLEFGIANVTKMVMDPNGNVGIGTTGPRSKLDVVGPVHATAFLTDSDMRLKESITPLTGTLDKLDKIHGVSFKWNTQAKALGHSTDRQDVGVIAQEVATVFPELVTASGPENYQAVDYSKLTAVLLEAVKELKAEVKELKTENQKLKNRMAGLESK